MGGRELGLRALGIWYRYAGLQFQGITFDQAVAYYDAKSPSFIKSFGEATKYAKASDLDSAMQAIATGGFGKFPDRTSFFNALAGEVLKFDYEDAKAAAAGTVKDVVGVAKSVAVGFGIYYAVAGLLAVYLIFGRRGAGA